MALPRWLTATVGKAAQAAGRTYDYLPGQGTSTLTKAGRSISDPNQVYTGSTSYLALNPISMALNKNNSASFQQVAPNRQNAVLSASASGDSMTGEDDPFAAYGQAGGAGVDAGYRNTLADKLRSIISAYDSLSGGVDTVANDAISNYQKQYGQQSDDLNNEYAKTTNQMAGIYGARGLADSSYYGNAQDEAKNTYNSNVQSLIDNRNQGLSTIGQQAATAKASYGAGRSQYSDILSGLNNYDQSSLNSLGGQLPGAMAGIQQAQAGQGTQADFIRGIQGLPALQQQGGTQLQAQLQKLVGTGAPNMVKSQIAQGLINQAQLQDPNANSQWQNYWQQLIGS